MIAWSRDGPFLICRREDTCVQTQRGLARAPVEKINEAGIEVALSPFALWKKNYKFTIICSEEHALSLRKSLLKEKLATEAVAVVNNNIIGTQLKSERLSAICGLSQ
jgi:tRNA U34 5-methylaminomethyl-2-thiouridine-forming methyltransferase MnmC